MGHRKIKNKDEGPGLKPFFPWTLFAGLKAHASTDSLSRAEATTAAKVRRLSHGL